MSKRMEAEALKIETYSKKYDNEIITLILDIQNKEFKINLPLQEQPDLLDIGYYYQQQGGEFWIVLSEGHVVGILGLMKREHNCAIMKKFFVKKEFRSRKVGISLYNGLLHFAKTAGIQHIILAPLRSASIS